jgi:hypothetical protein
MDEEKPRADETLDMGNGVASESKYESMREANASSST